ncbi:ABC transporter permease [Halotalea alkalilenta]|uniref:ABC transporter permease n=1 Tax=Halotalea alkalilenta TaxID=376489 RepID=UPI0004841921|nr:ABC transporter permease [Halotalea alkalilenta]
MRSSLSTRLLNWSGKALVILILAFVVLPAIVVVITAFGSSSVAVFPPRGYSLRWFENALGYRDFQTGLRNGVIVMLWASSLAMLIGTTLGIVIHRFEFRAKRLLEGLLLSPLYIPHFMIGLGLLMLTAQISLARGFAVVVFCHVLLVLPFVLRSVYVSLHNLDPRTEQAAASLGAPPLRVVTTITLPQLLPGLAGGWLFAAILSFNEFTASLFLTTQTTQTLPVAMYNYVREYADPTLAAISSIYILFTAALMILADRLLGLGRILNLDGR